MWSITREIPKYGIRNMRRTPANLIIFIDETRPIEQGDIVGDFAWRRKVSYAKQAKDPNLLQLVADYLKVPATDVILKFNRYAGCSMCPCSPGLLAYIKTPRSYCSPIPAICVKTVDN